jgi:hypothetical protein
MLAPLLVAGSSVVLILAIGVRVFWRLDGEWVLRRIARRCEIHDRAHPFVIRRLEAEFGFEPSPRKGGFADRYSNPELIDCGHEWCWSRRRPR